MLEQRFIDLYDSYTHSNMPRREFLERLTKMCGSVALATALLPALEVNYAQAAIIAVDDKRLATKTVKFGKDRGAAEGYWAAPAGKDVKSLAGVIVIHENKGLQPYIKDVARRLAVAGYVALAPDALSPVGGTPSDAEKAKDALQKQDAAQSLEIFKAGVAFLDTAANGRVGCVGFCWGGAMANSLSIEAKELDAAVAFYGRQPAESDVPKVAVPVQLHYAEKDERINQGIKAFEAALKKHDKPYELYMYPGVQHAFHNDTAGVRFDKNAADLAWQRTLAFFKKQLQGVKTG